MKTYNKIIFVCNGNTCRSPIAATIMKSFCKGKDLSVLSRGMIVLFEEPYNPKAVAVCSAHNMIMPNNPASQLSEQDFGTDVLILTMTEKQKNKIYLDYTNAINVYTICEYAQADETEAVQDPYGHGIEEYKNCFDKLYVLISKVAERMFADEEAEE